MKLWNLVLNMPKRNEERKDYAAVKRQAFHFILMYVIIRIRVILEKVV
ncbi:MAG: hypothetical protein ABIG69_00915 [Bacteroidota bacterium]